LVYISSTTFPLTQTSRANCGTSYFVHGMS
jgi:hypothetical protein